MKKQERLAEAKELRQQASGLYLEIACRRKSMLQCNAELANIIQLGWSQDNGNRMHELRDQIFGYRIEIESLYFRAQKLLEQARSLDHVGV